VAGVKTPADKVATANARNSPNGSTTMKTIMNTTTSAPPNGTTGSLRCCLYCRVSTIASQDTENQRLQLRNFAASQGWQVVHEYEDHESGGKADRAGFRAMLQDAAQRSFDLLLFWALDRLTREGTLATLKYLEVLESYHVRWRSLTEPWIDSAGPFRDVIISLLASLAKQERTRIRERVKAGLDRARLKGTRSGRPIGRPRVIFRRDRVTELREQGLSLRDIARKTGVSYGSVRRTLQQPTAVSHNTSPETL